MVIKFRQEYLEDLYKTGQTADKRGRLQPQIIKKYRKTIDILQSVAGIEGLFVFNSLHFEALHGDREGLYSVRINDQYRIEFTTIQVVNEAVITICNIENLSNHYK